MTGPKDIPARKFIGVDGHEAQEEDSPSYYNNHESIRIAEQVCLSHAWASDTNCVYLCSLASNMHSVMYLLEICS